MPSKLNGVGPSCMHKSTTKEYSKGAHLQWLSSLFLFLGFTFASFGLSYSNGLIFGFTRFDLSGNILANGCFRFTFG